MFAKSMPSISTDALKRKSVFADDKQPWPSAAYKRQCCSHVARDRRVALFGMQVPGKNESCYAWVPKDNWQARYTAGGSIAMQRVLRESDEPASADAASKQHETSQRLGRPALPRFGSLYDLQMQAEESCLEKA